MSCGTGKRDAANSKGRGKVLDKQTQKGIKKTEAERREHKKNYKNGFYIHAGIAGEDLDFLIDTGASECFISNRQYEKLAAKTQLPSLRREEAMVILADGAPLQIKGRMTTNLRIGEEEFPVEVIVGGIQGDAILGMGFLLSIGCQLDFERMQMRCGKHLVQCHERKGWLGCRRVQVKQTMMIPAGQEMIVTGKIKDWQPSNKNAIGLIEPSDRNKITEDKSLLVARTLVDVARSEVPVRVCNLSTLPMLVYKNTLLGMVTSVDETDVLEAETKRHTLNTVQSGEAAQERKMPEHLEEMFKRSVEHLDEEETQKVADLLIRYQDVFSKGSHDLGCTGLVKHSIDTGDSRPLRQPYRRLPQGQQEEADRQVKEMLEQGIIQPSSSPWASPIILVKKKDGTMRFCVDYRRVNNVTVKDAYPLPRIDDTFDTLSGSRWFSTLDLASGYWQVELDEEAKIKSAFCVRGGLFQWKVMPFGLCNAPSTFERLMEQVFRGMHWKILLLYLDDVIVFGQTFEEELERLEKVFQKLRVAKLKLKPKKCHLFQKVVHYLGHVVSEEGVATDPEKIETVKNWPTPENVDHVRSFLCLVSYYRRFIKNFASVARPLHRLTEKNEVFEWSEECEQAFQQLKSRLVEAPILGYPAREGEYILDTDASGFGLGGVLSQVQDGKERVIAYVSKTLNRAERNYCVTRRELLAVVKFIKHFKQYLYGREFTVRTDHAALRWLLNFKNPEGQLARWIEVLSEYHFTIQHRPGRHHGNADGLSRRACRQCGREEESATGEAETKQRRWIKWAELEKEEVNLRSLILQPEWSLENLRQEQEKDDNIRPVLQAKMRDEARPSWSEMSTDSEETKTYWAHWERIQLREGVLYRRYEGHGGKGQSWWQLLVPRSLRSRVLQEVHSTKTTGHLGEAKTVKRMQSSYYWMGYAEDVRSHCRACKVCGARRMPAKKMKAALQQYHVGAAMERVAMDILGPFPESKRGNRVVLVVGDYFTKWTEAFALPDQTAETIAQKLVEEVFCRHGIPLEIHSDQGRNFESTVMKEVCRLLDIGKTRTTPYNPKSDGMVERFNRTLVDMISKMIEPREMQKDWDEQIPYAMMAYRSAVHNTTQETPNMMMLGREVRMPMEALIEKPPDAEDPDTDFAWGLRNKLQDAWSRARKVMGENARVQKKNYDRKVFGNPFETGESVWYLNARRKKGECSKLQSRWLGPYIIKDVLSAVTYRIQQGRKKPLVVHYDRLKPCRSEPDTEKQNELIKSSNEQTKTHMIKSKTFTEHAKKNEVQKRESVESNNRNQKSSREIRPPGWLTDFEH